MILGGLSLSEEPISSQRVTSVSGVFSTNKDLPIETSPFLAIEPKGLCWKLKAEDTSWILQECCLWSFECNNTSSCDTCD